MFNTTGIANVRKGAFIINCGSPKDSALIAAFDLDHTLVKPNKGRFAKHTDPNDYVILFKNVVQKLQKLDAEGYKIVIFTNQSGAKFDKKIFAQKVRNISAELGISMQVYGCTEHGYCRKPSPGLWRLLTRNNSLQIDLSRSFYVGDAYPGAFSDSDYKFALNVGVRFYTPEGYFQNPTNVVQYTGARPIHPLKLAKVPAPISYPRETQEMIILVGPPASGKCFGINTPIIMFDGSIKLVQNIKPGDKVMGDDSQERLVLGTTSGTEQLYKIKQKNADDYIVNQSHILSLKVSSVDKRSTYRLINCKKYQKGDVVDISVMDYLKLSNTQKHQLKGFRTGIEFQEQEVFDPYLIGLWLGDGTSSGPKITNQDSAVIKYLIENLPKYGCYLRYQGRYTYRINGLRKSNHFLTILCQLNLVNNKHVPNSYMYNSRDNQLNLLAGFIDTDGSYTETYCIVQKSYKLLKSFEFIARCLGFGANTSKCIKSCVHKGKKISGTYYRLTISGENIHEIPCKIKRKQAKRIFRRKNNLSTDIVVEPLNRGTYYGFETNGNHRFLLGDHTVTHNSTFCKQFPNYVIACQDDLGTKAKVIRVVRQALVNGKSAIVDRKNEYVSYRREFIDIARERNIPVRVFWFDIPRQLSEHLSTYREIMTDKHIPTLVFNKYYSKTKGMEPPTIDEGVESITKFGFVRGPVVNKQVFEFYLTGTK